MEEKKEVTHSLHLEQRGHGLVTGVTEMKSFDEENIFMETSQGTLAIRGSSLHVCRLELEKGEAEIEGKVDSMGRELELLVQSMICGALLVLVYDGIRIFRIIGKRVKSLDTAVDILFWSAAGLFLFFMCLRENGGSVRCYLLCGILLGAGVWYWGIGHFYREFAFILAKRLHFCLQRVTIFLLVKMRKFCLKIRKGPGIDKSKGAWNEKKEKCCARKKRRSTTDKGSE